MHSDGRHRPIVASGFSRTSRLHVVVSTERGRAVRAAGLAAWLTRVAPPTARGVVSIALVSDRRIRELNLRYRRKDSATDVLSFPAGPKDPSYKATSHQAPATSHRSLSHQPPATSHRSPSHQPPATSHFLGDIVIARGVARRQAQAARHSELTELKVLALHGLLHLLGYDHEGDTGQMQRVERRLRRNGGLREGLIERGRESRPARR